MSSPETIAAIATAPAPGAIGIVRISGPAAWNIWQRLCQLQEPLPPPRTARLVKFWDEGGDCIDEGLAIGFRAPASFSGEDSVELNLHGNPLLLEWILKRVLDLGARLAHPGEFSQRAFINNKLDLAQAEAVADLISAGSQDAIRAAQNSLQGLFSEACEAITSRILMLRAEVEAWLDFPEEDIDPGIQDAWQATLATIEGSLETLLADARQGCQLNTGLNVLLLGAPNTGKSTLLNALAQREVALVSDIQGTTRDLVAEQMVLNGVPIRISDSAGLRDSTDPIEQMGVERALQAAQNADRILCLSAPDAAFAEIPKDCQARVIWVHNKTDLLGQESGWRGETLYISAKTRSGLNLLADALCGQKLQHSAFSARQRHLDALELASRHLQASAAPLNDSQQWELAAEELRQAQQAIGLITGEVNNEELLGTIFSSFCIGK